MININNHKIYISYIWFIIVPLNSNYVYKIYKDINIYKKELFFYNIFTKYRINIPKYIDLWKINNKYFLKLENIRKNNYLYDTFNSINIWELSKLLNKIYWINWINNWNTIILNDIHSTNFFKRDKFSDLWIFDFSSNTLWFIEKDIACIYIELWLNDNKLKELIWLLNYEVELKTIFYYAIIKIKEMLDEWMNINSERKKIYITYLSVIKNKLL